MKPKVPSLKLLNIRYKAYFVPLAVFLVSIGIIVFLLYPQASDFVTLKTREEEIRSENQALQEAFSTLSSLSDAKIEQDTQTVKKALPVEKDYLGILSAIASSARDSGIGLDDYSLAVGDISTGSAKLVDSKGTLPITLRIRGPLSDAKRFLSLLLQSVPLASVEEVSYSGGSTEAKVLFYYELYSVVQPGKTKIVPYLQNQNKIMQDLALWASKQSNVTLPASFESLEVLEGTSLATASATVTPSL